MSIVNPTPMAKRICCGLVLILLGAGKSAVAQLNQKPSPLREPTGSRPAKPSTEVTALAAVKSRADFDMLQRTYYAGTRYAIPHILFVVDRSAGKVFYVNAQKFRFHKDFLYAEGLAPAGAKLDRQLYFDADRRFVIGTIAWQPSLSSFTWELWEGDLLPENLISQTHGFLTRGFFEKLTYKPNSSRQEDCARKLNLPSVTQADLAGKQSYLALNTGKSTGRVRFVKSEEELDDVEDYEIVVMDFLPLKITPVRGVIVSQPSTPLSHINILAHGWKIPNVFIRDASNVLQPYAGQWIQLVAEDRKFSIQEAEPLFKSAKNIPVSAPPADTNTSEVVPLENMARAYSVAYGAKAANLGEIAQKLKENVRIPQGFGIPFHYFADHMHRHGLDKKLENLLKEKKFQTNKKYRRAKLAELRDAITRAGLKDALAREIRDQWQKKLQAKPVFVRSSSNLEDVADFSGAGLYYSAANQRTPQDIMQSVKRVWASLYSFEAFEARKAHYVDQQHIFMAVIVQTGVDMDRGGVLITRNPYLKTGNDAVLISAVCGHNSQIADNRGMPEQVLVNYESDAVIVWTRSTQQNALRFAAQKEFSAEPAGCADEQGRVLSDQTARALAKLALKIRAVFDDKIEQDIEWGIENGKIYILQSRPYRD